MKPEKRDKIKKISIGIGILIIIIMLIIALYLINLGKNKKTAITYKKVDNLSYEKVNMENIDINSIIENNVKNPKKEEINTEEIDLEYTTIYKNNEELPKGMIQVLQEGRDGKQKVITKKIYEGDILIKEEQTGNVVTKSSINKIIEIGTSKYISNYKVKKGDTLYVTSYTLNVMRQPNMESEKVITLTKNTEVKLIDINKEWYKISIGIYEGWVNLDCLTYINPNKKYQENTSDVKESTKSQLISALNKNMDLNKSSGLTIEQFKKVLSNDSNDKNKILEKNAQYFYYIEKQYNINGIFVASIAIHESAWGSSKIAIDKNNLFGYGANDSDPYNNAYKFQTYSEGIDLISRVLVKYYLNPAGTKIYDNQIASGRYYSGSTLSNVNKKYATDSNWSNAVYKWMTYLYNKL